MAAWLIPLITALGFGGTAATSALSQRKASNKAAETDLRINQERIKAEKELAEKEQRSAWERLMAQTAAEESTLDPFRQQLSQGNAISWLDRMERERLDPVKYDWTGNPYASYIPTRSGGYSYEQSPELRQSAADLKRNVMSGATAPTMTDPANFGRTAALNLLATAGGVDPASAGALAQPYDPTKLSPLTDPYKSNAALRRQLLGAKGVQITPRGRRTT